MPKIAPKLSSKPSPMTAPTTSPSPTTPVRTTSPPHPSPPPPPPPRAATSPEPTWLTGPALKAANEHTYATQRAKKAADRAKGKMPPRKLPSGSSGGRSSSSSSFSAAGSPATMTSFWAEVWEAQAGKMISTTTTAVVAAAAAATDDDLDWPELSNNKWCPSPSSEFAPLRPTQDREVSLSALVRPVKPRGAKAKAKEGEFEFLPPVKNVIALDDAESNVPDEPWEYISSVGGDDEARKIFSYAEIVSKST